MKIKHRSFWVLYTSEYISVVGNVLYNLVFLVYATQQENNFLPVAIAGILPFIPRVLMVYTGHIADKITHPFSLAIVFKLVQSLLFLLVAYLLYTQNLLNFILISIIMLVVRVIGDINENAFKVAEKHSLEEDEREKMMGFTSGIESAIYLIFQSVGVGILTLSGNNYSLIALINAVTFLLSLGVLVFNRRYLPKAAFCKSFNTPIQENNKGYSFVASIKSLMTYPEIRILIVLIILINFFGALETPLLNLSYTKLPNFLFHGSVAVTMLLVSLSVGIGELVGSFSLGYLKGFKLVWVIPVMVMMNVIMGMGILTGYWQIVMVASFITGLSQGVFNPKFNAWFMNEVPENQLATAGGAMTTASMFAIPIGQCLGLIIAGGLNLRIAWMLMSGISIIVILFFVVGLRNPKMKSIDI